MNALSWMWLAAMVLFAIVEASTVAMVSLWFVGGSLIAFLASLLGAPLWLQGLLFVAVSLGLIACLRPFLKKFIHPKLSPTNFDRIVGMSAPVTERIDNLSGTGAVKVAGSVWSARSESGDPIEANTVVKILYIQGVKVIVTPV